jgi:DNA modification methylase
VGAAVTAPRWTSLTTGSHVYEADAREVAATLPDGCASLAVLDGPYGMSKAAWDRVPPRGSLVDLYRGHLEDVGRLCAPSASLYVWNTSAGWAELHPVMVSMGWGFRCLIVWDKETPPSMLGWRQARAPLDATEVCGFYARERWHYKADGPTTNVWRCSTKALSREMLRTGETVAHRSEHRQVAVALHPCQKPLAFADRILRASSRPGDTVWVPFGGTLRELVAAEHMARRDSSEARRVITCELNRDGVDYIGPAIRQAEGRPLVERSEQVGLWGRR